MYAEVSASPPTKESEAGPLSSVSIEPSDNGGFLVRCSYKPKPTRKSEMSSGWVEPKTLTFESKEAMLAHIEALFGAEDQ